MQSPIPAQITQVKTMARSVRIVVDTQEVVTPEQMAELFKLYEQVGWFFFLKNATVEIDPLTLPDIKPEEGQKSRAVRLRGVLYRVWEQQHKDNPKSLYANDSEVHYNATMDKLIEKYKEMLA